MCDYFTAERLVPTENHALLEQWDSFFIDIMSYFIVYTTLHTMSIVSFFWAVAVDLHDFMSICTFIAISSLIYFSSYFVAELAWRISFKVCRTHCSCLQWGVQGFSFFRIGTSFDFRSATVGACIFSFCSWASKIWLQSKLYWICHFWFSFWSTWLILEFIGI